MLRASKKILLVPGARVTHLNNRGYTAHERADFLMAQAVFQGKYNGFPAGLKARLASVLRPLVGFRIGELRYTLSGQKIDGTQS
jgi:hypothetical protein